MSSSFFKDVSSWFNGDTGGDTKASQDGDGTSSSGAADMAVRDPTAAAEPAGAADASAEEPPEEKKALWAEVSSYVGRDVLSLISLPIWLMEPTSSLQKVAETFEYASILDVAAKHDDPNMRVALVAAFGVSAYAGIERTFKPFNPILGETFQLSEKDGKFHLLAEQVSHHPPISVTAAKGEGWTYLLVSKPKTKFLGNSVEVYPIGRTRVTFPEHGETYYLLPPTSKAHNIIMGSTWVDTYGTLEVRSADGKGGAARRCILNLSECGWFGADRYQVKGVVKDEAGECKLAIEGKWNFGLDVYACDAKTGAKTGNPQPIYRVSPMPSPEIKGKYNFTRFCRFLNQLPEEGPNQPPLLATDSRIRPDRWNLDLGDDNTASAAKAVLETQQRAEAATRKEKGLAFQPRHFAEVSDAEANLQPDEPPMDDIPMFELTSKPEAPHETVPGKVAGAPQGEGQPPAFAPWEFAPAPN